MNYNIKGTAVVITPEIRTYIEKRLLALDKFFKDPTAARADIELEFLADEAKQYRAEFTLHGPEIKNVSRVSMRGSALYEAIDMATGELSRELSQSKKKSMRFFRRSAARVKDMVRGFYSGE